MGRLRGFTLVELLVVIAIFAILPAPEIFGCPSSNYASPRTVKNAWDEAGAAVNAAYFHRLTHEAPSVSLRTEKPALIMDYNRLDKNLFNHRGVYANILFIDGSVQGFPDAERRLTLTAPSMDEYERVWLKADGMRPGE